MDTKCKEDEVITETIKEEERGSGQSRVLWYPHLCHLREMSCGDTKRNAPKFLLIFIFIMKNCG